MKKFFGLMLLFVAMILSFTSCSKDDEDAYGLFAQFCMKLNVFALILSAIA